jgi:crotonobetainyl-CoA:carnitine CoA-transferase CaiB-like acyl-CoA transferase
VALILAPETEIGPIFVSISAFGCDDRNKSRKGPDVDAEAFDYDVLVVGSGFGGSVTAFG